MSVVDYKNDYDYARSRLRNTLVRCFGRPFYIKDIRCSTGTARGYYTVDREEGEVLVQELDLNPPRLGYVNAYNTSVYVQRSPTRYWKQGLDQTNTLLNGVDLTGVPFGYSLMNKYPDYYNCFEHVVNGEVDRMAFSLDFALGVGDKAHTTGLMFRGNRVGKMVCSNQGKNVNIFLDDKFGFLGEMLGGVTDV